MLGSPESKWHIMTCAMNKQLIKLTHRSIIPFQLASRRKQPMYLTRKPQQMLCRGLDLQTFCTTWMMKC
jgi:hypothetical protein